MKNQEVVLIVGGAGGIGSAVTKLYAENGHRIILSDNNIEESEKLTKIYNIDFVDTNILDYNSVEELKNYIKQKYGKLNHIITIAGGADRDEIIKTNDWEELSNTVIEKTIQLNVTSHIVLIKEMLSLMKHDENKSIVLTSSINAIRSYGIPSYSAAKAALYGFMIGIADILGKQNIRINTVSPGTVPTTRTTKEHAGTDNFERMRKNTMLGEFTKPSDIANAVYALTHILTAITGQNIIVDNGQSLKID